MAVRLTKRIHAAASKEASSVSVLIAAYNAEPFLARAVASALAQTVPPVEVLIVDDASTDGTRELARELATFDGRIRLVALPENGGPSLARNAGIDAAKGDWVAILDADDAYLPERLECMLDVAQQTDADIVVDNFRYYRPATEIVGPPELEEREGGEIIDIRSFVSHARPFTGEPDWGLLKPIFRKAFLDENRLRYPTHSRHGEDFLLMVDALLSGGRYALVRHAGYIYTERSSGWSRTVVDYYAMRRHSEALLDHPRVANDPELAHCFHERLAALKRLSAEWNFARCRQQRDSISLAAMVVKDATFRSIVAEKLMRKLKRVVGHE